MKVMRVLPLIAWCFALITLTSCAFTPFAKIPFTVVLGSPVTLATEEGPTGMVSADFDGDGHLDLVSIHSEERFVSVFKGDGAGGFTRLDPISVLRNPSHYQVMDLNEDGLPDLLILQNEVNKLAVLSGDTASGLKLDEQIELAHEDDHDHDQGFGHPRTFKVADFNGDGLSDLILGYSGPTLEIFYGALLGGFHDEASLSLEVEEPLLEAFDANQDGIDDLLVFGNKVASEPGPNRFDESEVFLYLGTDDGFAEGKSLLQINSGLAVHLRLADLNGDGLPDPVMTFFGNSMLTVLPNMGLGAFDQGKNYLVKIADGIAFADLEQDGDVDIITSESRGEFSTGRMSVFLNAGGLRLREPKTYETRIGPSSVVSGDFDENGFPDLAVINLLSDDISLYFNETNSSF